MIFDISSVNCVTFVEVTKLSQIKNSRCVCGGGGGGSGTARLYSSPCLVVVEKSTMV